MRMGRWRVDFHPVSAHFILTSRKQANPRFAILAEVPPRCVSLPCITTGELYHRRESRAQTWQDWFQDFVVAGNNADGSEKRGTLEFLSPYLAGSSARRAIPRNMPPNTN
jgi:hypothetical protein